MLSGFLAPDGSYKFVAKTHRLAYGSSQLETEEG
jgi:hypothetical protein